MKPQKKQEQSIWIWFEKRCKGLQGILLPGRKEHPQDRASPEVDVEQKLEKETE